MFSLEKEINLVRRDAMTLGALAGMASLFNPPLISLLVIHTLYIYHLSGFKEAVRSGGVSLLVAGLMFLLPNMLLGLVIGERHFIYHSLEYSKKWASFRHFLEWKNVTSILLWFLWYSIAMPVEKLIIPSTSQFVGYFESPEKIVFLVIYTGFILYLLVQAVQKKDVLIIVLSCWIAILILFYLYWWPEGAMLYSPQILFIITIIIAQGFAQLTSKWEIKYFILGICSLYLMVHNIQVVYSW